MLCFNLFSWVLGVPLMPAYTLAYNTHNQKYYYNEIMLLGYRFTDKVLTDAYDPGTDFVDRGELS